MISENDIFKIGKLIKPHGIKGEIAFAFENDIFDKADCPYLICLLDGIYVPFFIEEYRFKGKETALMKFEGLNSEEEVRRLNNAEVYFPRSYFDESEEETEYSWNYFIGFSVTDIHKGNIGVIEGIDDSTINILFVVNGEYGEILIPASEDFITEINAQEKSIQMNLPKGLLDVSL